MTEALLRSLFHAAVARALAERCVPPHLPAPPRGRTMVLGAGKAAAAMAKAVEDNWPGPLGGLVVTRDGHGVPCRRIEVVEAAHPVPDRRGQAAALRILDLARGMGADDLVLCLISGGASALLSLPAPGVTLADKQDIAARLLISGATIAEINCVRKHLSGIKGGRLGVTARPASVLTLAISDVAGDDPSVIGSGPTVADPSSFADALAVLEKYAIVPPAVIADGLRGRADETPKPGDQCLSHARFELVASPADALEAAAALARARGYRAVVLGDAVEGEARAVAREHAEITLRTDEPSVLVSGGETWVRVRGGGRGGRNAEYLLALALALDGRAGVHAIACDTDGIDGTEANAGCVIGPETLARARHLGVDAQARLDDNDAFGFFAALDDLVVTGPTRTNVNDFRAIVVEGVTGEYHDPD